MNANASARLLLGRLSKMSRRLKLPGFRTSDFSLEIQRLSQTAERAGERSEERRRQHNIAFQELAAIPDKCAASAFPSDLSPTSLGWRIMDEMLLTCLILAQYPPRFVKRRCSGQLSKVVSFR